MAAVVFPIGTVSSTELAILKERLRRFERQRKYLYSQLQFLDKKRASNSDEQKSLVGSLDECDNQIWMVKDHMAKVRVGIPGD